MQVTLEDWNNGWYGIQLGITANEIDLLNKRLQMLKEDPEQHFHVSSTYQGSGGIGDIIIYTLAPSDIGNMHIGDRAIAPGEVIAGEHRETDTGLAAEFAQRKSNQLDAFVAEARRFCHWASGDDGSSASAREAVCRTANLYSAALELPRPYSEGLASDGANVEIPPKSLEEVAKRAAELPINFYGETLEPLLVPPGDTGLGSTVDDVGDIYREIARGLMLYDLGRADEALWEWWFGFQTHWGKHATGLLRALHYYLVENDPDGLSRADQARES